MTGPSAYTKTTGSGCPTIGSGSPPNLLKDSENFDPGPAGNGKSAELFD